MSQIQAVAPMPDYLQDGYEVHRAALAHGMNILLLPRQVLLASDQDVVPSQLSFTHGVPEYSTVSAVTFAHDRRLRRDLLARIGVRIPEGQSFSYRNADRAATWAEQVLGFPVVVKEVQGENPAESVAGIKSKQELWEALQTLRRRDAADRSPGSNPRVSGYATTRFGFEIDDDGNQLAPAKTRFLVEKHLTGKHVRVLACEGSDPIAVVLDPETGNGSEDISAQIHPSLHAMALKAVTAIPGLAVGSVDFIVDDYTVDLDTQQWVVVELAERIRSETYEAAAAGLGNQIGDALVSFQAAKAGIQLGEPRETVDATLRIEGVRDTDKVANQFSAVASEYGVTASATVADDLEGLVDANCQGSPAALAELTEALMSGLLLDDRAYCVETRTNN